MSEDIVPLGTVSDLFEGEILSSIFFNKPTTFHKVKQILSMLHKSEADYLIPAHVEEKTIPEISEPVVFVSRDCWSAFLDELPQSSTDREEGYTVIKRT